jgi:hypothetical protein
LSAQAPKDMLVTGRPRPTGLAGRQLFENCQVCQSAPSDRPEAKTLEILGWRSIAFNEGTWRFCVQKICPKS